MHMHLCLALVFGPMEPVLSPEHFELIIMDAAGSKLFSSRAGQASDKAEGPAQSDLKGSIDFNMQNKDMAMTVRLWRSHGLVPFCGRAVPVRLRSFMRIII